MLYLGYVPGLRDKMWLVVAHSHSLGHQTQPGFQAQHGFHSLNRFTQDLALQNQVNLSFGLGWPGVKLKCWGFLVVSHDQAGFFRR